jgi:hypothetical protein
VKYHGGNKPRYPDLICNGLWEYRPDFSRDFWKKGAATVEDIRVSGGELMSKEEKAGAVVWILRCPYVIVGSRLEVEGNGAKFSLSWDGKSWMEAGSNLDKFFPPNGPARYEFRLRCELPSGARLKRLGIVNDLQMAPLALPAMSVGKNQFLYTDQSQVERKIRITHEWVERSTSRPPEAPIAPIFPPHGGETDGTDLVFRWKPASDPDGDRIIDYHFELSDRQDMKWPLSTNFCKLVSRTADRGKAQYTLPQGGLLAPDHKYYWRVRAKDEKGVWGPWSSTWSFTPRGPLPPVDVTLVVNPERTTGILHWKPNPAGRNPVKYRVYGSDEKGFSVSDRPFKVTVGTSKEIPSTWPANFLTEISATDLVVIGTEVKMLNMNRAFYRVVAVDEQGKRSGPSDFAEAPRPILYSPPVTTAKVGSEYRYQLSAIRSLGDLRTRLVGGKEVMNYWEVEAPRFAVKEGPNWLKIDGATGLLSGNPDGPGIFPVVVAATIDREIRKLDAHMLSWGIEKTVATNTERVGIATQKFSIKVTP